MEIEDAVKGRMKSSIEFVLDLLYTENHLREWMVG
jgi:hypothetical protein